MPRTERPDRPDRPSAPDARRHPPKEEPDFVNEADIPTEDPPSARRGRAAAKPDASPVPRADVAGNESAAGEEDPGAALDAPPTPRSPA
jgi:hypothetical protein